jgi:hypothetical protein
MDTAVSQYREIHDQLVGLHEAGKRRKDERLAVLNHISDLRRFSPSGEVGTELEAQGAAIEAECRTDHDERMRLTLARNVALEIGLMTIGTHYGALAQADADGSVLRRFARWWGRANEFRKAQLDGLMMPDRMSSKADAVPMKMYDPEGPMFGAFAKAFGYRSAAKLSADLELEIGMREGLIAVNLEAVDRLGMFPTGFEAKSGDDSPSP